MNEEKRFYTFVFAPTASSPLRKFAVPHKALYVVLGLAAVGLLTVAFGAYKLSQHAYVVAKLNLMQNENRRLKEENSEVKNNMDQLQTRLVSIETTSRKLAEAQGFAPSSSANIGSGGPSEGNSSLSDLENTTSSLELQLRQLKDAFDKNQVKLASTPSGWPVLGYITDGFGMRANPFGGGGSESHGGLDISAPFGTGIDATADGIVIFAGMAGGYGNVVVVDHGYGITTRYAHMSRIDVKVGDHVNKGKQLGAVGSTGRSTAPHCHYEVRLQDRPVNPMSYISTAMR
jgi:murein DD-endopeptidase MepM/ murein hydrolase activator NlpD